MLKKQNMKGDTP